MTGLYTRAFPLDDIHIRAGDGRTVEAYASVFDVPAPVRDQDGQYMEQIDRRAYDKTLRDLAPTGSRTSWRCQVLYHHGMTLHGTPSERGSVPIAVPQEIRADGRGLLVLDEPTLGLAPVVVADLLRRLGAMTADGTAILLAEQRAALALSVARRGIVLSRGRVVRRGSAAELAADPMLADLMAGA